ncbi:MAG: bacteriohemerythrin [Treponema sp.]|jgi:hemerythrin|nr:bacteriohemerythrin [Treponema sp.]
MISDKIVSWHTSYSISIPLIDTQHKELINLTNKLYQSCMEGRDKSRDVFMEVLRGAVDYVGYHFGTEEKVMERVSYPGYGAHKKEHTNFVKEVLKTADDLSKGINPNPLGFVYYLRDWVLTHIAVSDTLLGQYLVKLRQQGHLQNITLRVKQVADRFIIG